MQCIAFGAGTQGQLGNGSLVDCLLPSVVHGIDIRVLSVACGGNHAICLAEKEEDAGAQQLFVWGLDHLSSGLKQQSLGNPIGITPNMTAGTGITPLMCKSVRAVSCTSQSATAAASDFSRVTNTGKTDSITTVAAVPRQFQLPSPDIRVTRLAAGWSHTLLLTDLGQLFVAGDNSFGQLGLGQQTSGISSLVHLQLSNCLKLELLTTQQSSSEPMPGCDASDAPATSQHQWCAVDVAAGLRHSLVLLQLRCHCEQLYNQQPEHTDFSSVVAGFGSNKRCQLGCARGTAYTNTHAQPAAATTVQGGVAWLPCLAEGLSNLGITRLSAGGDRSAGITRHGQLLLWGRALPIWGAACEESVRHRSDAVCGQVASNVCHISIPQPQAKADWLLNCSSSGGVHPDQQLQWVDVKLGWRHMVALDSAGQLWTAGDGSLGQLGTGIVDSHKQQKHHLDQEVGQNVEDASTQQQQQQQRTAVTAHGCVAEADSQPALQAEPAHQSSSLGDDLQPVAAVSNLGLVSLPALAIAVAAGAEHCAAVLRDGSLYTWGWGEHGQLGVDSTVNAAEPQHVKTAWPAAGVACGSAFTVGWSGSARCRQSSPIWCSALNGR